MKVGGTTTTTTSIDVPGKRNTYTRIECCCQGIVYCNEALSLTRARGFFSYSMATKIEQAEKGKKNLLVLSNRRKKSAKRRTKDNSYNFAQRVVPLLHPDILRRRAFFLLLLLLLCSFLLALYETMHRSLKTT